MNEIKIKTADGKTFMSFDDLSSWLPIVIFAVVMIVVVVITIVGVVLSIVLSLSPFAVIGWLFAKKSKEANEANRAALNWHETIGRVVKSRVEVSGGEFTSVTPRVIYEYEVNGQIYKSSLLRAGDKFLVIQTGGSRTAYDIVDKYPEGAIVTVYYNPQNPSEAVLER